MLPSEFTVRFGLFVSVRFANVTKKSPLPSMMFVVPSAPDRSINVTPEFAANAPPVAIKSTPAARSTSAVLLIISDVPAVTSASMSIRPVAAVPVSAIVVPVLSD